MEKISKSKKIIYGLIAAIILIGTIMTFTLKLNFSLMYSDNTRIRVYLGKEYDIKDVKAIAQEVFETNNIVCQEVEVFKEAVSITVQNASDEQVENLTNKLKEKYEIETLEGLVQTSKVPHLQFRDIVKPYIIPVIITTAVILVYLGIRYMKIGILKTVFTLVLRIVVSEALLMSIIAIARIPVGQLLMPVAMLIYLIVTILTIVEYQRNIEKVKIEEK